VEQFTIETCHTGGLSECLSKKQNHCAPGPNGVTYLFDWLDCKDNPSDDPDRGLLCTYDDAAQYATCAAGYNCIPTPDVTPILLQCNNCPITIVNNDCGTSKPINRCLNETMLYTSNYSPGNYICNGLGNWTCIYNEQVIDCLSYSPNHICEVQFGSPTCYDPTEVPPSTTSHPSGDGDGDSGSGNSDSSSSINFWIGYWI
ncbi:MAG: hypothetical protein KIT69_15660, partial [Propionibacteriaceae bacterium]|nr:hypothetical protein [Propionibacteriaceae bacterium]